VAGVKTLEQANHYLETEFLPWVNTTLAVVPASADDAHRPLEKHHGLAAILSPVESRGVNNDCTILFERRSARLRAKTSVQVCVAPLFGSRSAATDRRRCTSANGISRCAQRKEVPVAKVAISWPTASVPRPGDRKS